MVRDLENHPTFPSVEELLDQLKELPAVDEVSLEKMRRKVFRSIAEGEAVGPYSGEIIIFDEDNKGNFAA